MVAAARQSRQNALEYLRENGFTIAESAMCIQVHRDLTQYEQRTIEFLKREHGFTVTQGK